MDDCGLCYESDTDPSWNSCVDSCGFISEENDCTEVGISYGDCSCAGCLDANDPNYCDECEYEDQCQCDNTLRNEFHIDINNECTDNSTVCTEYSFSPSNDITFDLRKRCGILTPNFMMYHRGWLFLFVFPLAKRIKKA